MKMVAFSLLLVVLLPVVEYIMLMCLVSFDLVLMVLLNVRQNFLLFLGFTPAISRWILLSFS